MSPPANLKCIVVHLVCRRCRATKVVFLTMDHPVPEQVRCSADRNRGPGVAFLACDSCDWRFPDIPELRRLVQEAMRGRNRADHLRNGAVRIEC